MSLISHNDYIHRVDLVSELRTMFEVQLTTTFVLSHHKHTRAIDLTTAIYEVYSYKGTNIQKKCMIQRKETTYDSTSSDDRRAQRRDHEENYLTVNLIVRRTTAMTVTTRNNVAKVQ